MKNTAIRRIVAVTSVTAGAVLLVAGVRGMSAGGAFGKSGPSSQPKQAAEDQIVQKHEVRITSGTGEDIQRAINSLPEEGGRIFLSAGVFRVSKPLVIDRDNVEITGDQELTVLKLANRVDIPLLVIGQTVTPIQRRVSNITVRKMILDGNRLAQDHECNGGPCDNGGISFIRNNALTIRGAEDVKIQHVTTRAARSGGVVLEKECRRISISDFISHDNHFDGFAAYETEESVFTRMHLHNNAAAGISADIRFNRNIISFARLENNGSQGIFMRDSNFNNFTGLTITGNGQQGIFIAQADDAQTTPCTGNVFSNLTVKNSKRAGLRVNDVSCVANTVARSQFISNGEGGVSEASEKLIAQVDVNVE